MESIFIQRTFEVFVKVMTENLSHMFIELKVCEWDVD